jgi:tetratricopeptide (TPR) repeat protein
MNDEGPLFPLDDRPGPATRLSSARASALVDAALDQAALAPESVQPAARAGFYARVRNLRGPLRALALAASVLLLIAGGAAAAKLIAESFFEPGEPAPAPKAPTAPLPSQRALAETEQLEAAQDELVEVTLEPSSAPSLPRPSRKAASERASAPEDLLQRASRARAAGKFAEAAEIYAEVYERYPRSLSAYVAQIAAGSIELEHLGRPERARRLFLHALRVQPKGTLDLEARQGLVIALRDLGEREQEAQALRALIEAHPARPAARRALIRLRELGQTELVP